MSQCIGSDSPKFQLCPSEVEATSPASVCYFDSGMETFCYSVEVIEAAGYLVLLIWVIWRNIKVRRFKLELLTLAVYAALSFFKAFSHVVMGYNCMPDELKQLFFVLPLLFLFYVYGVMVYQWLCVLQSDQQHSKPGLILSTSMCSAATLFVILTYILYCVFNENDVNNEDEEDGTSRMVIIGATNIGIAVLYVLFTLLFAVMGGKIMLSLAKLNKSALFSAGKGVMKKVFIMTIGASICFLAYGGCLLWEGCEIIGTGFFYFMISNEYTAPGWLELLYFVFQITPAFILMAITSIPRKSSVVEDMSFSDDGSYDSYDPVM